MNRNGVFTYLRPPPASVRVLRMITRLNIGGPTRHVLTLTRELGNHGFESELASGLIGKREGTIQAPPSMVHYSIPSLRRELNPLVDAKAALELSRLVRRRRPTVVHTHQAKAGTLGRAAAGRAGVPLIIHTYHGHVLDGYFSGAANRAFIEIERRLAHRTDVLIAVSSIIRDELLNLGIGEPEQWQVIPVGLELRHLTHNLPMKADARRSLGLPARGLLVGIVGRLAPVKDLPTFISASAQIAKADPTITYVVAGDGPLRSEVEREAKSLLGDKILFLGWEDNLSSLYSALDVVVLTSRNEGTPVALIEAAAAGLPVVGTEVGGVPDVIVNGRTGFLVQAKDSAATAECVLKLRDAGLRKRLGEAGRLHVQHRFAASRLVEDIAKLYRSNLFAKGYI